MQKPHEQPKLDEKIGEKFFELRVEKERAVVNKIAEKQLEESVKKRNLKHFEMEFPAQKRAFHAARHKTPFKLEVQREDGMKIRLVWQEFRAIFDWTRLKIVHQKPKRREFAARQMLRELQFKPFQREKIAAEKIKKVASVVKILKQKREQLEKKSVRASRLREIVEEHRQLQILAKFALELGPQIEQERRKFKQFVAERLLEKFKR